MYSPRKESVEELTLDELRSEFLKTCDSLDRKARDVALARQELGDDQTKELQVKIKNLEVELTKKQRRRNNLLRQVRNYKALSATSSSRTKGGSGVIRNSAARPKSRSAVIKQLQEYQQKHRDDPNINLALLVLSGKATPEELESMMEPEQEAIGFGEVMKRREQLQHYRQETDNLTNDIFNLQKEYARLEGEQDQVMKSYQEMASLSNANQSEFNSASRRLNQKREEVKRAEEYEERAAELQKEIDANALDDEHKIERINRARESALAMQLQSEIAEIDQDIEKIKEQNAELQAQVQDAELRSPKKTNKEEQIEQELERIKQESKDYPHEASKFEKFINEMESKALSPRDVVQKNEMRETLKKEIQDLQQEIEEYENKAKDFEAQSEEKRRQIEKLDNNLNTIAHTFEKAQVDQLHTMPEFTDGAPSIQFKDSDVSQIADDQTAIKIKFREFQFERSFIGKKPSQVFLVVDLLEHQSMQSKPVDINSGNFDSQMLFVCKNDFILSEYLERTSAAVQLCRQRESSITEAAWTELNLLPFLRGHLAMTQTIPLWNKENKHIGKVTFEAAIYRAPKQTPDSPKP